MCRWGGDLREGLYRGGLALFVGFESRCVRYLLCKLALRRKDCKFNHRMEFPTICIQNPSSHTLSITRHLVAGVIRAARAARAGVLGFSSLSLASHSSATAPNDAAIVASSAALVALGSLRITLLESRTLRRCLLRSRGTSSSSLLAKVNGISLACLGLSVASNDAAVVVSGTGFVARRRLRFATCHGSGRCCSGAGLDGARGIGVSGGCLSGCAVAFLVVAETFHAADGGARGICAGSAAVGPLGEADLAG